MSQKRILVVEDNPQNLKLVRDLLECRGHDVVSAVDGASGIDKAQREIPDLILMDVQLPGMDGLDATRRLKADSRTAEIPVIAVTAHALQGDSSRIRKAGCDGYITKPIDTRKFVDSVEAALRIEAGAPAPEKIIEPGEAPQLPPTAGVILVVDDDDRNRKLVEAVLFPEGYRVIHAENGEQALKSIVSDPPDLVLLDVIMPGMDGYDVTRRIRSEPSTRALPIVLITAHGNEDGKKRGIECGCDEFVQKPFDRNELLTRIRSLIRISEFRKRLDERERLDVVLREVGEGVILLGPNWEIDHINSPAMRLLNINESTDHDICILDELYSSKSVSIDRRIIESPETNNLRFEVERDETPTSVAPVLSVFLKKSINGSGNLGSVVLTLSDITERWQADKMKEEFLSTISHKLKTPLSVILGNAESLVEGHMGDLTEVQLETLRDIASGGKQLSELVDKLLEFTSGGFDRGDTDNGITVATFLDEYEATMTMDRKEGDFEISFRADEEARSIRFDTGPVRTAFNNLIENAIKFSEGDTVRIEIEAGLEEKSDTVEFRITDNGPGIAPEHHERIFDKFYQIEKYKTGRVEGVGLGLALVRKTLATAGGSIHVRSKPGEGATFLINLPLGEKGPASPAQ